MKNEEKAQQIMGCNRANCLECGGSLSVANGCTEFERIMAMARWKDKELKKYLDELLAKLNACEKDRTREATVVEIIKGHFFKNVDLI